MSTDRKCEVVLLDDRVLTFSLQPRMLAVDLFDLVSSHFGLKEKEFFGLYFKDDTGHAHWLSLDRKVLDQDMPRKLNPIILHFAVRYYIETYRYLEYDLTVELFYMQAKQSISAGSIECEVESAFELTALALQESHGDFISSEDTQRELSTQALLPTPVLRQHPSLEFCVEEVSQLYQPLSGQSRGQAIVNYMSAVERIPTYGIHYYEVKDKAGIPWWLGISYRGIAQYDYGDKLTPRKVFHWKQLENLYFRDKKFSIEVHDTKQRVSASRRALVPSSVNVHAWFTSKAQLTKTIWSMAVHQHQFYLDRKQTKESESPPSRTMTSVAVGLDELSNRRSKSSQSSTSLTSADAMVESARSKVFASPDSKSLSSAHSSKADLTPEQQAAQQEVFLGLKARRDALAAQLMEKQRHLQQVCLQEAEITGSLPEDYPLLPGETSLPNVKKRVGTSFSIKVDDGTNLQEDRVNRTRQLQMDYDLQFQITKASHKLASDHTLSKGIRKKHKVHYEQAKGKLDDLEKQLAECKAFTTDDFDVNYSPRGGIRLLKGADKMRSSPQLEDLSSSPGMRRRAPSTGSMRYAGAHHSHSHRQQQTHGATPSRRRHLSGSGGGSPRTHHKDTDRDGLPDFVPSNMLQGPRDAPPSSVSRGAGAGPSHSASGLSRGPSSSSAGGSLANSKYPGANGAHAAAGAPYQHHHPSRPAQHPSDGDNLSIQTVNSTHSQTSSSSLGQLHAYSVSGARPIRSGSMDDVREVASSAASVGSSTGAASGSPAYHDQQRAHPPGAQYQRQDRQGLTDSPSSVASGGSGGRADPSGHRGGPPGAQVHPYSAIRQREKDLMYGASGGNPYNSLERVGRRRNTPPTINAPSAGPSSHHHQEFYNQASGPVAHQGQGMGRSGSATFISPSGPAPEHRRARSPGRYASQASHRPVSPGRYQSQNAGTVTGTYNSLDRRGLHPTPPAGSHHPADSEFRRKPDFYIQGPEDENHYHNLDSRGYHSQHQGAGQQRGEFAERPQRAMPEHTSARTGTPPSRPGLDYPTASIDRRKVSPSGADYEQYPQHQEPHHQLQHPGQYPRHPSHSLGRQPKTSGAGFSLPPSTGPASGDARSYRMPAQPEYQGHGPAPEQFRRDQQQSHQGAGREPMEYPPREYSGRYQERSQQPSGEPEYRREAEPQCPSSVPVGIGSATGSSEADRDSPQSDIVSSAAFMFDTRQHSSSSSSVTSPAAAGPNKGASAASESGSDSGKGSTASVDGSDGQAHPQPHYSRTPAPQTPARPHRINNGGGQAARPGAEPYQSLLAAGSPMGQLTGVTVDGNGERRQQGGAPPQRPHQLDVHQGRQQTDAYPPPSQFAQTDTSASACRFAHRHHHCSVASPDVFTPDTVVASPVMSPVAFDSPYIARTSPSVGSVLPTRSSLYSPSIPRLPFNPLSPGEQGVQSSYFLLQSHSSDEEGGKGGGGDDSNDYVDEVVCSPFAMFAGMSATNNNLPPPGMSGGGETKPTPVAKGAHGQRFPSQGPGADSHHLGTYLLQAAEGSPRSVADTNPASEG